MMCVEGTACLLLYRHDVGMSYNSNFVLFTLNDSLEFRFMNVVSDVIHSNVNFK